MTQNIRKWTANVMYYTGFTRLRHLLGNNKVMILAYHRIDDLNSKFCFDPSNVSASTENFAKQMSYLSKNYNIISLDVFMDYHKNNMKIPKNSIIITFDDGYRDSYTNAYPVLKKLNIPATIYLTCGYMDSTKLFWWDELAYIMNNTKVQSFEIDGLGKFSMKNKERVFDDIKSKLKNMDDKKKVIVIKKLSGILKVTPKKSDIFLSWKDARIMNKNKVSFGAHTMNHPILTNISLKEAETEMRSSKSLIEKNIKDISSDDRKVSSFAYPNGHKEDFNEDIIRILKKDGFKNAVTYIPGWASNQSDLFRLNRVFVKYDDNMIVFKNKLIGMDIFFGKIYYFINGLRGKKR